MIGSVKLFVRLDEHKYRKMVQFYVTPAEYDVCLLGLSSLRGLHWVGSQWPRDIPEVNSGEGRKTNKIRDGRRSTSSLYSEEGEQTSRRTKRFKQRAVQMREEAGRSNQRRSSEEWNTDSDSTSEEVHLHV